MHFNCTKIIKILVLTILLISTLYSFIGASYGNFVNEFNGSSSVSMDKPKQVMSMILDIVRTIGVGIAVIILIVIGVKIMLAAPSERANIKQYSINYVIGALILIGISGFLKVIKRFAQGLN